MSDTIELPLFPLDTVLFPDGAVRLRVFEPRYLDMAAACLRTESPFGICLIAEGKEVGPPARPHAIGTVAHIVGWDMLKVGMLEIAVQGGSRFRIISHIQESSGLLRARVELIAAEPIQTVPRECAALIPLLRAIVVDLGERAPPAPHRFFDAAWVGYRWCEILTIPLLAKQKLLELDDSRSRLEILLRFLTQKGLLK